MGAVDMSLFLTGRIKMSNYDVFAKYYDSLMKNANYTGRADYLLKLIKRLNHDAGITLDLACGTGSLTLELHKRGLDIYGVDSSHAMLSIAMEKAYDDDADILFLCQKMEKLDLYGTVQTVICSLDSINHVKDFETMQIVFDRVSLFLEKDCYFIFDFNTPYKHKEILNNNSFVYETDEVFCVWQNSYSEKFNKVDISLDFFEKQGESYYRSSENFSEISCDINELSEMLTKAGFESVEYFDNLSFDLPTQKTQRLTVVARK